jgi:hypothetical protein
MSQERSALLALAALAATAGTACAHRLDAQCFVRPGWHVQVESWYETGDPPRGARVDVFGADGKLLTSGKLDKNGVFVFPWRETKALKVVVTSVGHRAEATVTKEALERAAVCSCTAALTLTPPLWAAALLTDQDTSGDPEKRSGQHAKPMSEHTSTTRWRNAFLGVTGLLALAVLFRWISLRRQGRPLLTPLSRAHADSEEG